MEVAGLLLAYHMAGATLLPGAKRYATRNADKYGHCGGGKALIDGFAAAFGEDFDNTIHTVTNYLEEGETVIGGIRFLIHRTADAFDVEIPEINAVYTHMLGHDCHSIVAGSGHAGAMVEQLKEYLRKEIDLILTRTTHRRRSRMHRQKSIIWRTYRRLPPAAGTRKPSSWRCAGHTPDTAVRITWT